MNVRIKQIREQLKCTQSEFADRLGIQRNTVASWEIGHRVPSDMAVKTICDKFGVNEVWLRTGEGEMFRQMSRDEEITKFIAETLSGSNEFKSRLIAALARLDESDWEHLEQIARKMLDEQQQK